MMGKFRAVPWLVVVIHVFILLACADTQEPGQEPGVPEGAQLLERGSQSGYQAGTDTHLVMQNEDDFLVFWQQHTAGRSDKQAPPVDFTQQTVIALLMAQRNSGGYSVIMKSLQILENTIVVGVELRSPGENCPVTASMTNPYAVYAVDKVETISFEPVEVQDPPCGGGQAGENIHLLEEGAYSGYNPENHDYLAIQNQEDFAAFWQRHTSTRSDKDIPAVDFGQKTVIALMMARQTSGGYAVAMRSLEPINSGALVTVELHYPGKNCPTTDALTSPYAIYAVDKVDKVKFEEVVVAGNACGSGPLEPVPPKDVIAQGQFSGIYAPRKDIIDSQAKFDDIWALHIKKSLATDLVKPVVDFNTRTVAVYFMGMATPSCGHQISVKGLAAFDDRIELHLQVTSPADKTIMCFAATQPFVMVSLPKSVKPYTIEVSQVFNAMPL